MAEGESFLPFLMEEMEMAVDLNSVAMYKDEVLDKMYELWDADESLEDRFVGARQKLAEQIRKRVHTKGVYLLRAITGNENFTIQQLRENITTYYNSNFSLLSGDDVDKIVKAYQASFDERSELTLTLFEKFFYNDLQPVVEKYLKDYSTSDAYEQAILAIANENIEKEFDKNNKLIIQRRVRHHSRISKVVKNKGADALLPIDLFNELGKRTKQRIFNFIIKNDPDAVGILKDSDITTIISDKDKSISYELPVARKGTTKYIDWYSLTNKGAKESTTKKDVEKYGKYKREDIINTWKKTLLDYITQKPIPLSYATLEKVIDYMLKSHPYSVFVGKNAKNITGFLGELQSLCYLELLSGEQLELNPKILAWTGSNVIDKEKMHADIILKNAFGIQVKNTVKDFLDPIEFQKDISLDTLLEKLVTKQYISNYEAAVIKDIYTSYYFNVEYIKDETNSHKIAMGKNPKFKGTADALKEYATIADKMFQLLYGYFLHIGIGDVTNNEDGNVLFFIGGRYAILAEEIIVAILKQLDDETHDLIINRPPYKDSSVENIVSFVNDHDFFINRQGRDFISGKARQYGVELHKDIASKIIINSSYNFTNLVNQIYK